MSRTAFSTPPQLVQLECGHAVLFCPPVPTPPQEITCGICGEPTEVAR